MRICLINPPRITYGVRPGIFQPLGLAYVAAVLEENHEVSIIDAPAEGWKNLQVNKSKYYLGLRYDEIAYKVKRFSPDIVGITVPFTQGSESAFEVAKVVKGIDRNIIVILGGPHASVRPIDCLKREGVDFVVIGEGEHTIAELIRVVEQGAQRDKLKDVMGIAYLEDGEPIITTPRPLVKDLDSLSLPARHLLPMDAYFVAAKKGGLAPRAAISEPWATVITSRGCPYNCVFCSIHLVMGRKYRVRSPENVVTEIKQLVNEYGVKQVDFEDDNLALDKSRMEQICDLMIEKGLAIEWYTPNGVRADALDENLLMKMKRSGCKELWFSPESGVQRVVDDIIRKRLDLKTVEEAVTLCKKLGIRVNCYFVMGLIGETKEDIRQTIEYARKLKHLGVSYLGMAIATPYYGTEMYEQAREKGFLLEQFSEEKLNTMEPLIETPEFTAQELHELYMQAQIINPLLTRAKFNRQVITFAMKNPGKTVGSILKRAKYVIRAKLVREK